MRYWTSFGVAELYWHSHTPRVCRRLCQSRCRPASSLYRRKFDSSRSARSLAGPFSFQLVLSNRFDGLAWIAAERPHLGGPVLRPGHPQDAQCHVPHGRQRRGSRTFPHPARVLPHCLVTHVIHLVLDPPVSTHQLQQPRRVGTLAWQRCDPVDRLARRLGFARRAVAERPRARELEALALAPGKSR